MAAVPHERTAVSSLAAEVQSMLRMSNLDRRILDWIGMGMQEIISRMRTSMFFEVDEDITCTSGTRSASLTSEAAVGSPVYAAFVGADSKVYTPRYLEPSDFDRLEKDTAGGGYQTGAFPTYWTLDTVAAQTETLGMSEIRYFPQLTQTCSAWVWYMGRNTTDSPGGTDKVWLPYHWEHVLIWKTCAIGARMKKPQMMQVFEAEFEMAMQQMLTIMNYRPDQIPVLQEITGPGDETPQGQGMPQFPSNIG